MANENKQPSGKEGKFKLQELPVVNEEEDGEEDYPDENLTYIAYGERGEDVAFELSDNIEEAVEIYESMKEDGFTVKLYQAQELEIVDN